MPRVCRRSTWKSVGPSCCSWCLRRQVNLRLDARQSLTSARPAVPPAVCVHCLPCTTSACAQRPTCTWASAHRGKWGQLTPWKKMNKKVKKRKHAKRAVFYVYVIFWEQSGQAGAENGAMLTTYLFRYTVLQNAPFRSQIFKIVFALALRRQGGIDPLTKILRTFLHTHYFCYRTLPPSGECHWNSDTQFCVFVAELVAVDQPTKIGCHGNVPGGIVQQFSDLSSTFTDLTTPQIRRRLVPVAWMLR